MPPLTPTHQHLAFFKHGYKWWYSYSVVWLLLLCAKLILKQWLNRKSFRKHFLSEKLDITEASKKSFKTNQLTLAWRKTFLSFSLLARCVFWMHTEVCITSAVSDCCIISQVCHSNRSSNKAYIKLHKKSCWTFHLLLIGVQFQPGFWFVLLLLCWLPMIKLFSFLVKTHFCVLTSWRYLGQCLKRFNFPCGGGVSFLPSFSYCLCHTSPRSQEDKRIEVSVWL